MEKKFEKEVRGLEWQGKLLTERKSDLQLCKNGCFSWMNKWRSCPSHIIAGVFELYEQLLPTKLYSSKKTHTSCPGDVKCMCDVYVVMPKKVSRPFWPGVLH